MLLAWLRVTSGIFTLTLFVLAFMSAWLSFRFYRSQVIEPLRFGILVFIAFFVPMMYLLFFRTLFSHLFAR